MTKTFHQLQRETSRLKPTSFNRQVQAIIDDARVNADDTIYLEKAQPESAYNDIAIDTIRFILSSIEDKRIINYFAKQHGIEA